MKSPAQDPQQPVALVTGASSGIGAAIALKLEALGYRVFTAQRREGRCGHSLRADLFEPQAAERVIQALKLEADRLDVLVNNAGLMLEGTATDIALEDWRKQIQLNLSLPFEMIRAALPLLRLTQGRIINISSVEAQSSNPGHAAYCASKAGLEGLTRAIAIDEGAQGVRCNAVAPGWIDTPLNLDFIDSLTGDKEAFHKGLQTIHPLGRTGRPEEVADTVGWLASQDSSFVTGQIITIDGGRTAKLSLPS